jgi:DNA polymerase-3 subunit alpha
MKQKSISTIIIPLPNKELDRSKLIKLRDLVFKYPGECRLKFKINLNGEEMTAVAHNRYSIIPEKGLIDQIESLVGSKVIQEA